MKRKHLHDLQVIRLYLFDVWINDINNKDNAQHFRALDNFLGSSLKYVTCW